MATFYFVTAFVGFVIVLTSGSEIHFTASSASITPILTPNIVLRCSLNDTQMTSSGGLVGRDLTSTSDDVSHLVSLVMLRNGKDLATVSQFAAAHALMDVNIAQVQGQIAGATGERGYIEVTLQAPGEEQSGNYTCEANGIDSNGHNIVFAKHLVIGFRNPDISDVIAAVNNQNNRLREQEMKNQLLVAQNQMLETNLNTLMADINKTHHFESGTINCGLTNGSSSSWPSRNGNREKNITVTFSSSYDSPPLVHSGVLDVYYQYAVHTTAAHSSYVRYYVDLVSVDKDSFVLRCRTPSSSNYQIFNLEVNWMSVPN